MNLLETFGLKKGGDTEGYIQTLYNFLRFIPINPYDEEYIIYDPKGKMIAKIVKKGMNLPLFNELSKKVSEEIKKLNKSTEK